MRRHRLYRSPTISYVIAEARAFQRRRIAAAYAWCDRHADWLPMFEAMLES